MYKWQKKKYILFLFILIVDKLLNYIIVYKHIIYFLKLNSYLIWRIINNNFYT